MGMKRLLREFFIFSRSELRVLLVLACVIIVMLLVQRWWVPLRIARTERMIPEENIMEVKNFLSGLEKKQLPHLPKKNDAKRNSSVPGLTLFAFDPNTAGRDLLDSIGLDKFVIDNILKYREAGGRFSDAVDLSKIYGLDTSEFKLLRPFIRISKEDLPEKEYSDKGLSHDRADNPVKEVFVVEINAAGADEFKKIRGIGEVLATRIVRYRDLLGGFVSPVQLAEVYGLSDSLIRENLGHFRADTGLVRKLSVNTATYSDLLRHPYLPKDAVKAIMQFRKFTGGKALVDDLSQQEVIPDSIFRRISPYLEP